MPKDPVPFNKWDPDGVEARARETARHVAAGMDPEEARRRAAAAQRGEGPDPLAGKRWLLRWAWAAATIFMAMGYVIMAFVLTGHGDWLGL